MRLMHWQESWHRTSLKVQRKSMYNPSRIRRMTVMKRIVMALLMVAMVISLTACGGNVEQNENSSSDTLDREQSPAPAEESESTSAQPETGGTPEPSGNANLTDTDGTGAADI